MDHKIVTKTSALNNIILPDIISIIAKKWDVSYLVLLYDVYECVSECATKMVERNFDLNDRIIGQILLESKDAELLISLIHALQTTMIRGTFIVAQSWLDYVDFESGDKRPCVNIILTNSYVISVAAHIF